MTPPNADRGASHDHRPQLGLQGPVMAWQDPWAGESSDTIKRTGTGVLLASQDGRTSGEDFTAALDVLIRLAGSRFLATEFGEVWLEFVSSFVLHLGASDHWTQRFGERELRILPRDADGIDLEFEVLSR